MCNKVENAPFFVWHWETLPPPLLLVLSPELSNMDDRIQSPSPRPLIYQHIQNGWCKFIKQINIFIENLTWKCEDWALVGLQENGPGGLAWDTFHYVYELVQNGNSAFRENRMEEVMKIVCFLFGCSSECCQFIFWIPSLMSLFNHFIQKTGLYYLPNHIVLFCLSFSFL